MAKTAEGRRLQRQLSAVVKAAIAARRFIHSYAPMMQSELIEQLDKALTNAGATAAFTDRELAGQPCRDPGDGGCMGGKCETCAARARLHREWKDASP